MIYELKRVGPKVRQCQAMPLTGVETHVRLHDYLNASGKIKIDRAGLVI